MTGKRAAATPEKLETARRLCAAMKYAGVTQDQLAKAMNVSNPTAHQWMTGAVTPRPHRLEGIAKLVNVGVGWLLLQDDMDRPLTNKLLRIFEAIGRDRLDYLDSLASDELRDLIDAHELARGRTRRRQRDHEPEPKP